MKQIFKILKEELVFIPALFIILMGLKWLLQVEFPESAQFDIASETETVVFSVLRLVTYTSLTWVILRVVFPAIYLYIRDEFYQKFHTIEPAEKRKISLFIFFAFFFALILLSSCNTAYGSMPKQYYSNEKELRKDFVEHLKTQLNVREATGNNDGKEVEAYLKLVSLKKGNPWCAAFTSANLYYYNVPNPMSGYSPYFAKSKDIVWSQKLEKANKVIMQPQPGDCFTLYFANLGRVGHVGFVVGKSGIYFITIEGNTNGGGSRDGDGVYCRKRDSRKVFAVTNYITPYYNKYEKIYHHNAVGDFSNVVPAYKNTNSRKAKYYQRFNLGRENNNNQGFAYKSSGRWDNYNDTYSKIRHYLLFQIRSCFIAISIQERNVGSRLQMRCLGNISEIAKRTNQNVSIKIRRTIPKGYSNYPEGIQIC